MSQTNSTTTAAPQGFSLFQAYPGALLQWLPAVGTKDHDDMIHAFLPGPNSVQDKRAHISMDFYEFSHRTGQNFKFYPVPTASPTSTAAASPASSSAMYDSGYGSSFNASPVASDMSPWCQHPTSFAHVSAASQTQPRAKLRSSPKKKSSARSTPLTDIYSHPGMRIMTKDGLDVTDSASRSCKTKEQRDHAHLMRIIKACDSCRRKKIRCDPSHKKRTASQAQASRSPPRKAKEASFTVFTPSPLDFEPANADLPTTSYTIPELDLAPAVMPSLEMQSGVADDPTDDLWEQFITYGEVASPLDNPYDFFTDPAGYLTPASDWSYSNTPLQSLPSCTPLSHEMPDVQLEPSSSAPALPYLNPGGVHGSNYVDFNLYSPTSDFLDEEPQITRKLPIRERDQNNEISPWLPYVVPPGLSQMEAHRSISDANSSTTPNIADPYLLSGLGEESRSRTDTFHGTQLYLSPSNPDMPGLVTTQGESDGIADRTHWRRVYGRHPERSCKKSLTLSGTSTTGQTSPTPVSTMIPPYPHPNDHPPVSTEDVDHAIGDVRSNGKQMYTKTAAPTAPKETCDKTLPSMVTNAASTATARLFSRGPQRALREPSATRPQHTFTAVIGGTPSGTILPVCGGVPRSHLHAKSSVVHLRQPPRPTSAQLIADSSSGPLLLSRPMAASVLLAQTMCHTKSLVSSSLCRVLACCLVYCLLVSGMDPQGLALWPTISAIISLGSAILLARNVVRPTAHAQRPSVSTCMNMSNPSTRKSDAVSTVKRRFPYAATKLLASQLSRFGSVLTAGIAGVRGF